MKKTLFLLAALGVTSGAHAAVGDTLNLIYGDAGGDNNGYNNGYLAEGVSGYFSYGYAYPDVKTSTRFYDSTKGWSEIKNNSAGDSRMCWAHTTGNMIQYWQSYYGVFYKDKNKALPYGSDYSRTVNPSLGASYTLSEDPMRLNTTKTIITVGFNSTDTGGRVVEGTNFYFTRHQSGGGFFSEYFGAVDDGVSNTEGQTATVTAVNDQAALTSALLSAMGISKQGDGSYKQTEAGLIAHLNVGAGEGTAFSAHTLTCYGFTLDANGNVNSLVYADSDNYKLIGIAASEGRGDMYSGTPTLEQAFVKVENGKIMLYTDAACTTKLDYGTQNHYYLGGITQINTPEVLQNMLAEYSDVANEAQVWNGNSNEWKAQVTTTEELPTESTGWDVLVDGDNIAEEHRDYYHTYSTDGRNVLFGDHAAEGNRTVIINGTVSAGHIEVAAKDYRFEKGTDGAIAAGADMTVRSEASLDSEVALALGDLELEQGALLSSSETITVSGAFLTSLQESASFGLRNAVTPSVSVDADLDLREATSITLNTAVNMNGNDLFLSADTPITISLLQVDGTILLFENIGTLSVAGITEEITQGMDLTQYFTITSTDSADLSGYSLVYADGALSMSIVPEPATATLSLLALAALTMRRRRK